MHTLEELRPLNATFWQLIKYKGTLQKGINMSTPIIIFVNCHRYDLPLSSAHPLTQWVRTLDTHSAQ